MKNYSLKTAFITLILTFIIAFNAYAADETLASRLKGRLLLAVESNGEVWYVDTNGLNRRLITAQNAVEIFRKLALGITNSDLDKIPADYEALSDKKDSDNDGFSDKTEAQFGYKLFAPGKAFFDHALTGRLKGKLLLQTEDHGRIWYVSPMNGKKYEIEKNNVLKIFRKLALGITNSDLSKISKAADLSDKNNNEEKNNGNGKKYKYSYNKPIANEYGNSDALSLSADAIVKGNESEALRYFSDDLKKSVAFSLQSLDENGRSLFAAILINASLIKSSSEEKHYSAALPFNGGWGAVNIKVNKQADGAWLIAGL